MDEGSEEEEVEAAGKVVAAWAEADSGEVVLAAGLGVVAREERGLG